MTAALRGRLLGLAVVVVAAGLTALTLGALHDDEGSDPTSTTSAIVAEPTTTTIADDISRTESDPEPLDAPEDSRADDPEPLVGTLTVEIVEELPGDPTAYVQGLEFLDDGTLLRSDGRYGSSDRNRVDPLTGEALATVALSEDRFAEGLTVVGDEVFQLTWQEGVVEVADLETLATTRTMSYAGEGWGLCWDGERLVMSDGSSVLTFRDPESFAVLGSVEVVDAAAQSIDRLNELECVGNQVLANRYGSDSIVVIDAETGEVDAVIDASAIRPAGIPPTEDQFYDYVLNGIARDRTDDTYLLTGKWWPATFRVRIVPG